MTQYRNSPADHAIRYHLFERVSGELHEQQLVSLGVSGDWLGADVRQALMTTEGYRAYEQQIALTPLIDDFQTVVTTRPRYIAHDPLMPTGAYHVESIQHHFAYDGERLPKPADHEALLYRGGNCVHPGGEPVAAVRFKPERTTWHDPYQQLVIRDKATSMWVGPTQPSQQALAKGYLDLLGDMVRNPGSTL